MSGVALAYAGVHQIFQLALAAHELGRLDGLFCSIIDGPRKWGGLFSKRLPAGTVRPLGSNLIPSQLITEFPWPLVANRLGKRLISWRQSDHLHSNLWFGRRAARWLSESQSKVFVGSETCALECLRTAKQTGMRRILDCPGVPSQILDRETCLAAEEFGVSLPQSSQSKAMDERKQEELDLAEVVLCCSEFQRSRLVELNPQIKRSEVIPLWTDVDFWKPVVHERVQSPPSSPLRVLYAGAVSVKKGVPYLLRAVEQLGKEVSLTLVGVPGPAMSPIITRFRDHRHFSYMPKAQLRNLYREHDVLVMPTLGDSFGFVTVEAMASGMPVIASVNAGAPVPNENWRVPVRDAEAISSRLLAYSKDRDLLRHDAEVAAAFGERFRSETYRARAAGFLGEFLAA